MGAVIVTALIAIALTASALPAGAQSDNPFLMLAGTWSGSGTARFDEGRRKACVAKAIIPTTANPNSLGPLDPMR